MNSTAVSISAWRFDDEVQHLCLDGRVESGRRLVEDQERRVLGERHRDHDALLHPARELVGVAAHHGRRVGDLHAHQRLVGTLLGFLARHPEHRERLGDLRADAKPRVQRGAGVLVDHRHRAGVVVAEPFAAQREDVLPRHRDRSARDPSVAREVADDAERRGRLPAAGLADEAVGAAALDGEGHASENRPVDASYLVDELEVRDVERAAWRRRSRSPRSPSPLVHLPDPVGDEVHRRRRGSRSRARGRASSTSTGR